MADEGQDRTEAPSPRRREEARKQGQIAYSPDLAGSVSLMAGLVALSYLGPEIAEGFFAVFRAQWSQPLPVEMGLAEVREMMTTFFIAFVRVAGPILALLLVTGVVGSVVQVGFHITPERLEVNFDKLSPANGMSRLLSVANIVKGGLAIVKVLALAALVLIIVRGRAGVFGAVGSGDVGTAAALAWALLIRLSLYIAGAFLLIGVTDYAYQRYRFEQSLRVTKQELKEELKREEGDPLIKGRMRQIARELARRRMMAEVPKATVVITNPSHIAIALRYDRQGKMKAPRVVAKGAGFVAENILELAREHGVPVVERPPVARALYKAVELDREIPPELFAAVAEVIAFVYRLREG